MDPLFQMGKDLPPTKNISCYVLPTKNRATFSSFQFEPDFYINDDKMGSMLCHSKRLGELYMNTALPIIDIQNGYFLNGNFNA
ncbi:hypothetical protein PNH38_06505 [Anoxybacillus rupiensis]|jgi:hypothetical protein|uniref:Uncharacterized protein n=1 Tax=Anoxybacteroides rupiense TaxID=311460 RepID=A0ABT5W2I3_9BACL|nr:hypothetical protein [Anoxybacillus rupiensis]